MHPVYGAFHAPCAARFHHACDGGRHRRRRINPKAEGGSLGCRNRNCLGMGPHHSGGGVGGMAIVPLATPFYLTRVSDP